jgi:hypothetical protein
VANGVYEFPEEEWHEERPLEMCPFQPTGEDCRSIVLPNDIRDVTSVFLSMKDGAMESINRVSS